MKAIRKPEITLTRRKHCILIQKQICVSQYDPLSDLHQVTSVCRSIASTVTCDTYTQLRPLIAEL
jgi:hypothetical protein